MSDAETADTEETVTCLQITIYHPKQEEKPVFQALTFCHQLPLRADDIVKFGRDSNICRFYFVDSRVSRVQFSLQFFRHFNSSEFGFEIKNLSKKGKLFVDGVELAYLNKVDLPDECLVCFGEYQMQLQKQGGECQDYFNICFELSRTSLLQENNLFLKNQYVKVAIHIPNFQQKWMRMNELERSIKKTQLCIHWLSLLCVLW